MVSARLRRAVIAIGLVIVSSIVALVVLEMGVRLLSPGKYFAATVNTWDKVWGTRQIPGAKGFVKCPEYEMDLIINSKGLRDREFPYEKPDGVQRILCLGGSITCGYGVNADETWPKALESLLNKDTAQDRSWEVLNGGVGSTGTAHQLAYFETEGYRYGPDCVVLSFCQATDFWDNVISGLYTIEDGKLVKHDAPETGGRKIQMIARWIPFYNTVFARSHLLSLIKYRVARRHYRRLAQESGQPDDDVAAENRQQTLTRHLLAALNDTCASIGCRLVVFTPPLIDCVTTQYGPPDLVEFMRSQGIHFVDMTPAFRAGELAGDTSFYPSDGHWNTSGHSRAAHVLYEFFTGEIDGGILPD
jgi:hypothetical protein